MCRCWCSAANLLKSHSNLLSCGFLGHFLPRLCASSSAAAGRRWLPTATSKPAPQTQLLQSTLEKYEIQQKTEWLRLSKQQFRLHRRWFCWCFINKILISKTKTLHMVPVLFPLSSEHHWLSLFAFKPNVPFRVMHCDAAVPGRIVTQILLMQQL